MPVPRLWLALLLLPFGAQAVECSIVETPAVRATVCRVQVLKEPLRLFLRDEQGAPFKSFDAIGRWLAPRGQRLLFGMNAGMYRPDYSPSGLYVEDGRQLSPLEVRGSRSKANFFWKPNGVFLVSDRGARVLETSEYPSLHEPVRLATQSGPLLLRHGELHPDFDPNSASRLIRNGVGVGRPDEAVFVISDTPVNFHEFAVLFRDTLHCPDALFLDASVSSLHAAVLGRSDSLKDLGPIVGVPGPVR